MKVLSLFDGISCGMVALERAGIPVDAYYASEIDKNAIAISQKTILILSVWEMLQSGVNGIFRGQKSTF